MTHPCGQRPSHLWPDAKVRCRGQISRGVRRMFTFRIWTPDIFGRSRLVSCIDGIREIFLVTRRFGRRADRAASPDRGVSGWMRGSSTVGASCGVGRSEPVAVKLLGGRAAIQCVGCWCGAPRVPSNQADDALFLFIHVSARAPWKPGRFAIRPNPRVRGGRNRFRAKTGLPPPVRETGPRAVVRHLPVEARTRRRPTPRHSGTPPSPTMDTAHYRVIGMLSNR